jgi:hypothetical protein
MMLSTVNWSRAPAAGAAARWAPVGRAAGPVKRIARTATQNRRINV